MLVYSEQITEGVTLIFGDEAHHLIKVLRSKVGDSIKLFDGKGISATGKISKIGRDKAEIAIESIEIYKPKEIGRVIICASVAKGERYDWLVGKCTELGVDRIYPVLFERTVKQASGHSVERYNKLALSAAKQCGRIFLPQIDEPRKFADCLRTVSQDYPAAKMLFGAVGQRQVSIFSQLEPVCDYVVFIGPEGGLTDEEEAILRSSGAVGVGLTKTVLRIETAAIAFAAILCCKVDNII